MPLIKMTQADIASLPQLSTKMTDQQMADKFGVTIQWIVKRLKRLRDSGIDMPYRPRGRPRNVV